MGLFDYSKVMPIANKALNYRTIRQDLVSSNISNVDTPFYRPRDISFEEVLTKESNKILRKEEKKLALANTDAHHLVPRGMNN